MMTRLFASILNNFAGQTRAMRIVMGLAVVAIAPLTLAGASFQGLGFSGNVNAISADGKVVVGQVSADLTIHAFYWTASEGMVDLGVLPGGSASEAVGVSGDGAVIVGTATDANYRRQAFRWTKASGMVGLGFIGTSNPGSFGEAVSEDGQVIVGHFYDIGLTQGYPIGSFRWTSTTGMVDLGTAFNFKDNFATDLSSDGSVIVGFLRNQSVHAAYRWTSQGGYQLLGPNPVGGGSESRGVSADGSIILGDGYGTYPNPMFSWTPSQGMLWFADTLNQAMSVDDLSSDGKVAVGNSQNALDAKRWTAGGGVRSLTEVLTNIYGLDLTGWQLAYANGVSRDGSIIVGTGFKLNSFGQIIAGGGWRAEIPPQVPAAGLVQVEGLFNTTLLWSPAVFDPEGDALTCRLTSSPSNGIAAIGSDCTGGAYQPKSGFVGADQFTYVTNDGKQDSNIASVKVVVLAELTPTPTYTPTTPPPTPTPTFTPTPVICPLPHEGYDGAVYAKTAVDTPATWESNTKITNLCSIISPSSHGTATVTPLPGVTNTCAGTYVPNSGYIGSDSFQYYFIYYYTYQGLNCAQQRRGSVVVTVGEFAVSAINLTSVSGATSIWTPIVGNPYGKLISCRLGTPPANGTATVASDCSSGTYQSHPGFIGTDSFTYIANDGQNDSNPGTVTVAVTEGPVDQICLQNNPISQFSQTGKEGILSITFTGNITSHTDKVVKVCPGTTLKYTTTSTQGPAVCKVKNNTTRGSGSLKINDHIKCTDKPAGKDKIQFKVKSGVK